MGEEEVSEEEEESEGGEERRCNRCGWEDAGCQCEEASGEGGGSDSSMPGGGEEEVPGGHEEEVQTHLGVGPRKSSRQLGCEVGRLCKEDAERKVHAQTINIWLVVQRSLLHSTKYYSCNYRHWCTRPD